MAISLRNAPIPATVGTLEFGSRTPQACEDWLGSGWMWGQMYSWSASADRVPDAPSEKRLGLPSCQDKERDARKHADK